MIVGIILSAGESKRMGTPKQLLPWGDTIVLQHVVDVAAASRLERVELILGSRAEEIAGRITLPAKARLLINEAYREGMGSSVKCGVRNAPAEVEAYMLLLGDQPFVEGAVIDRLIDCHRAGTQGITIPVYNGRRGHPVIFAARYREELLSIGDQGAREVVKNHREDIGEVPMDVPEILVDMDTPQEYQNAKRKACENAHSLSVPSERKF
jgi:molybdenum cofactor cytidylyltransferase